MIFFVVVWGVCVVVLVLGTTVRNGEVVNMRLQLWCRGPKQAEISSLGVDIGMCIWGGMLWAAKWV